MITGGLISILDHHTSQFSYQVPFPVAETDVVVPQGTCLGPVIFSAYPCTLQNHNLSHGIGVRSYADDHGLDVAFNPTPEED